MQFDAIEARIERETGGARVFIDDVGYVRLGHRPWHAVWLHALRVGVHLTGAHGAARPHYFGACREVGNLCHPSRVHQLHKDLATLVMNRLCDLLPCRDVRRVIEAEMRGYPRPFGDGEVPSVMMRPADARWP